MDEPSSWVVVCEAEADFRIATELAEREVCAKLDWAEGNLDSLRTWRGMESNASFTPWKSVKAIARKRGIQVHPPTAVGRRRGQERGGSGEATKALMILALADAPPRAAVLVRDTDGDEDRAKGHRQARDSRRWGFEVVLALPHPRREAWVLAGFFPESTQEERRLEDERRALGFDPCVRAFELRSGKTHAGGKPVKRSTKRVLELLTAGDREREARCWREAPLESLRDNGAQTGLAEFLDEVDARLAPLVGA